MSRENLDSGDKLQKANQERHKIPFEDLPIEISLDILNRLPTTSLDCFKGVCKACYDLASHPTLTKLYKNRSVIFYSEHSRQLCLIDPTYMGNKHDNDHNRTTIQFKLPFMTSLCLVNCVFSCNGLVLVSYYKREGKTKTYTPELSVYNPLIEKFVTLPQHETARPLQYEDRLSDYYGFGFHPVTGEYKVVREGSYVYTLGTSQWRPPRSGCCNFTFNGQGVWFGGTLNWIGGPYEEYGITRYRIVSFDLLHESFSLILLPPSRVFMSNKPLFVLDGCLSAFLDNRYSGAMYLDIWSMTKYGVAESWTKRFSLSSDFICNSMPLLVLQNGKLFLMDNNRSSWYYDPETGSYVQIYWRHLPYYSCVTSFKASFVWPFR